MLVAAIDEEPEMKKKFDEGTIETTESFCLSRTSGMDAWTGCESTHTVADLLREERPSILRWRVRSDSIQINGPGAIAFGLKLKNPPNILQTGLPISQF